MEQVRQCDVVSQEQTGFADLVGKNDWPAYVEEQVETYTQDELDKFFAACTETENLWFRFFYGTAMREQEVMHCEWSWIDFEQKTATVRENKRFNWIQPKAYKGRLIPLSPSLTSSAQGLGKRSQIRPAGWSSRRRLQAEAKFSRRVQGDCRTCRSEQKRCRLLSPQVPSDPGDDPLQGDSEARYSGMDIRSVMRILGIATWSQHCGIREHSRTMYYKSRFRKSMRWGCNDGTHRRTSEAGTRTARGAKTQGQGCITVGLLPSTSPGCRPSKRRSGR